MYITVLAVQNVTNPNIKFEVLVTTSFGVFAFLTRRCPAIAQAYFQNPPQANVISAQHGLPTTGVATFTSMLCFRELLLLTKKWTGSPRNKFRQPFWSFHPFMQPNPVRLSSFHPVDMLEGLVVRCCVPGVKSPELQQLVRVIHHMRARSRPRHQIPHRHWRVWILDDIP